MTITPSRLLTRLDADIAASTDLVTADCLRAERAAYLARQGHLAEATKELEEIRRRHSASPVAAVSAWVGLAEGIVSYFEVEMNPVAVDKLQRAYAISSAAKLESPKAMAAAWLAQMAYASLDFDLVKKYIEIGLNLVTPSDRSAMARICLVMGQSLHLAGSFELAEPWYKKTREIALVEGDEPTVVALSHNMAWLFMSDLRRAVLTQNESALLASRTSLGSGSYLAANEIMQDGARAQLVPTLRAQVLSLTGKAKEALVVYETMQVESFSEDLWRFSANTKADLAWCYARVGKVQLALQFVDRIPLEIDNKVQIDELAATYSLMKFVYQAADKADAAARYADLARQAWNKFREMQDRIRVLLASIDMLHQSK